MDLPHVDDGGPTFTQSLAERLLASGMSLWRVSFTLTTMHPEVLWRTMLWSEVDGVKIIDRQHALLSDPYYTKSPVPLLRQGAAPIRVRLDSEELPFPICQDLKESGGTDYYIQGLPFSWGGFGHVSWATRTPGGFPDETLRALDALLPFLARRIELESSYHVTRVLLEVYLGRNAARRVLAGSFKRGQGELIHAAIWFCDLRGFTLLSDRTAPEEVVKTLDAYFDIIAGAVAAHGGEVLKFIGDAVLAIFPLDGDAHRACRSALDAAEEALGAVERLNVERTANAESALSVGIALHLGEVMYGNVGARERLDFTVISSSVNEASRLESLCKQLGTPLTLSEAFVTAAQVDDRVDLGEHELRGVKAPIRVFTLRAHQRSG